MDDAHLHLTRGVTRWLVCGDGVISLEGIRCVPLVIEGAAWIVSLLGSIVALVLICRTTLRAPVISYFLAAAALVIGYLGLLPPFSFCPRIVYCQTDGDAQFAFELNRLFAMPLALGASGLVASMLGHVICPTCQKAAIPFRQIWFRSTRRPQHCPQCGTACRLRRPFAFVLLGIVSAFTILASGYIGAGTTGFLVLVPLAVGSSAWVEYHAVGWLRLLETCAIEPTGVAADPQHVTAGSDAKLIGS